jgi:hypothetical protein
MQCKIVPTAYAVVHKLLAQVLSLLLRSRMFSFYRLLCTVYTTVPGFCGRRATWWRRGGCPGTSRWQTPRPPPSSGRRPPPSCRSACLVCTGTAMCVCVSEPAVVVTVMPMRKGGRVFHLSTVTVFNTSPANAS